MDHKQKSMDLLEEVDSLRETLGAAYAEQGRPGSKVGPSMIAGLHQAININLKLADVHSNLYVGDALTDSVRFGVMGR